MKAPFHRDGNYVLDANGETVWIAMSTSGAAEVEGALNQTEVGSELWKEIESAAKYHKSHPVEELAEGGVVDGGKTKEAHDLGVEHGKNAGTWVLDGNSSREDAARILKGIEDGDPEVLDQLPAPDLGGEWADSYTERDLLEELELDEDDPGRDDAVYAYLDGFSEGVVDQVESDARKAAE